MGQGSDDAKKLRVFFIAGLIILLMAILLNVCFGTENIPIHSILLIILSKIPGMGSLWNHEADIGNWDMIIINLRLPVVVMAMLVGSALATSGAALQGLFRNPLVDPFLIGISAGGAFGTVLGSILTSGLDYQTAIAITMILSFVCSLISIAVAYPISKTGNTVSISTLLLAGIALSAFLTALTQILMYFYIYDLKSMVFSLMGSLGNTRWADVGIVTPFVLLCGGLLMFFGRDLNAFSAGEDGAKHLGVDVEKSKFLILGASALITAVTVPFCGVIGFVGLIIPHIVRFFIGPDHRTLLPASAMIGATFLLLCDLISRNAMYLLFDSYAEIPVGIVTALVGGLFFIYLLATRRRAG